MLTNTKATLDKIFVDLKRFSYILNIISNCVYILVTLYALIARTGSAFINVALLSAAVAYFVFYILTYRIDEKKKEKKTVRRAWYSFRIFMTCISLSITVYGLYVATERVNIISFLLATLSAISWIFSIVTAVIMEFVENRIEMFTSALTMDFEKVTRPVNTISNAVRKIAGKEPKEPQTVSEAMERKIDKIREKYLEKKQKK